MTSHERILAIIVVVALILVEVKWKPGLRIQRWFIERRVRAIPSPYAHEEHYPQPTSVAAGYLRDETPTGTDPGQLPSADTLTQAYGSLAEPCGNTRCKWFGQDHLGDCEKAPVPETAPPLDALPAFKPGPQPWENEPERDEKWDDAPVGRWVAAQFRYNGTDKIHIMQPGDGGHQFAGSTWLSYPHKQEEHTAYVLGNALVVEDDAEGPMTRRVRENLPYIQDAYEAWLDAEIARRQAASMAELDTAFAVRRIREHAAAR